ncbi:MAG: hypothetical protein ACLR78_02875 [Roseburia sp.]
MTPTETPISTTSAKVSDTKYRDSSNSRNLTIVDYDTIIVNDKNLYQGLIANSELTTPYP